MADPQDPQQPEKILPGDALNTENLQAQQAAMDAILNTAKEVKKVLEGVEFTRVTEEEARAMERKAAEEKKFQKEQEKVRAEFNKKTYTEERNKFNFLVKEQKQLLMDIKGVHGQELADLRSVIQDKTQLRKAEADLIKKQELEIAQFKKKTQAELNKASIAARASEGDPLAQMEQGWNKVVDKAKEYRKSLLDTNSLWEAAIVLLVDASRQTADIAKSQAALRGAGLQGTGNALLRGSLGGMTNAGGELNEIAAGALGNLSDQLNLTAQDVAGLIQELAGAPHALEEVRQTGGKSLDTFVGGMGRMGISVEESIDIIEDSSNTFGLSIANLNKIMNTAQNVTKDTGINFRQVFQSMIRLTGQMRMLTFNSDAATNVLLGTVKPLQDLGFSNTEIQNFNDAIGNLLGQLSPTKLAGLVAFQTGRAPTGAGGRAELLAAAEKPLDTMVDFFKPVLSNFEKGSAERLFATQKLAEQMGFGAATTVKGAQAFEKIVDSFGNMTEKQRKDAFDAFKKENQTPEQLQAEGFKSLRDMRSPIENLEKSVVAFVNKISDPAIAVFRALNDLIPALRLTFAPAKIATDTWSGAGTIASNPGESAKVLGGLLVDYFQNYTTTGQLVTRVAGGRGQGKKG